LLNLWEHFLLKNHYFGAYFQNLLIIFSKLWIFKFFWENYQNILGIFSKFENFHNFSHILKIWKFLEKYWKIFKICRYILKM
jgi:hypothetical protein